ncbi:polyamine ABC transporter permease [Robbsia andropogonis]|uniref:Polyamine ABC transporter permease n=1 Tax=Robbsia andropogonis TaxID=28092 RepID=A0A0F5JTT3_9BURK|nr:ABC transporter permease [Robbsia andropogonis]KKB61248.1 polyamine ABC transporter permease [Robbsia andropogonis]MCP1120873.1 ABC transporter permease [Robbsia andropogonis]MCP1130665.1 ABC transporter permease [Robbsia andropogonis]
MKKVLATAFAMVVMVFLIGPMLAILPLAFTSNTFLTYPIHAFSFRWFEALWESDAWARSIVNSLTVGAGSTLLATVLGTLAALGLRAKHLPFAGTAKTLFLLPMVVPAVVLGVGMQIVFGRLGIASTYAGVVVAHTVLALPFVLVNVLGALSAIDRSMERAAGSLGAGRFKTFWYVLLPLAMPGIASGAVFAFATSLDEVVVTLFVAGPNQWTLALQMFQSLRENVTPIITAAASVLIVGTLLLIAMSALAKLHQQRANKAEVR